MSDRLTRTNEYTAALVSDLYRECLFDWLAAHTPLWIKFPTDADRHTSPRTVTFGTPSTPIYRMTTLHSRQSHLLKGHLELLGMCEDIELETN